MSEIILAPQAGSACVKKNIGTIQGQPFGTASSPPTTLRLIELFAAGLPQRSGNGGGAITGCGNGTGPGPGPGMGIACGTGIGACCGSETGTGTGIGTGCGPGTGAGCGTGPGTSPVILPSLPMIEDKNYIKT